jgi:SAM-dependent methyltransferase
MLTDDKTITTPEYWNKVYNGGNLNAKVDSSNTKRDPQPFDRFDIVVKHAEGPKILDIGSGHAHICKRIKALNKGWEVIASDQSVEARKVANYTPYYIINGYAIPFPDKYFDTVITSQALEYFEDPDKYLNEVARVSRKFLCTVPDGIMSSWSQLREYTAENLKQWLSLYGDIEVFETYPSLLLAKIRFHV